MPNIHKQRILIATSICLSCIYQEAAGQSTKHAPAPNGNASLARHPQQLPPSQDLGWNLTDYYVKDAGMTVSYPRSWKVEEHPEKGTAVKFTDTAPGSIANYSVMVSQNTGGSLDTYVRVVEDAFLSHLPAYKRLDQREVAIGRNRRMTATSNLFTFDMNGIAIKERMTMFPLGTNWVTIAFAAIDSQFDKANPLSNQVLVSISPSAPGNRLPNATAAVPVAGTTGSAAHRSGESYEFSTCQQEKGPVAFAYPKNWQVEHLDDPDHPLKISSKESNGSFAEMNLYCGDMHPYATVEQMLQSLEDKYYAGKKNYRLAHQDPGSFGAGGSLQGICQEVSFEQNGMQVRQKMAAFQVKDKIYVLSLVSPNWKDSEMQSLFSKVLATVRLSN
jgi:hypothetical protein